MKTLWVSVFLMLLTLSAMAQEKDAVDYLIIKQQFSDGSKNTVAIASNINQQPKLVASDTIATKIKGKFSLADYGNAESIILLADQLTTDRAQSMVTKVTRVNEIGFVFKGIIPYERQERLIKILLASKQQNTIYLTEKKSTEVTTKFFWNAVIGWILLGVGITLLIIVRNDNTFNAFVFATFVTAFVFAITAIAATFAVAIAITATFAVAIAITAAFVAFFAPIVAAIIVSVNNKIKVSKILIMISLILSIVAWVIAFMQ